MRIWRRLWPRQKPVTLPRVRVWNDLDPYKKIFVAQGFYQLARKGEVDLELVPYRYFRALGAPEPNGPPYHSHKNIVLLEVALRDRSVRIVYDANDLYYKIPNALLRWADIYFKSNYQESYLRTGERLRGAYWDDLTFRPECLPEPLDLTQTAKIRPCSFTMHLFPTLEENCHFLHQWTGAWLRTPCAHKPHQLFYLGRWWADPTDNADVRLTQRLLEQVHASGLVVYGGIVRVGVEPPPPLRQYLHPEVRLDEWVAMCCKAQAGLMTRGLDGCASFKTLNYLMLGAPFVAMEMKANFWRPLQPEVNYICIRDDVSDLAEQVARFSPPQLEEMGRRNLDHWQHYICPEATARHILEEAERIC